MKIGSRAAVALGLTVASTLVPGLLGPPVETVAVAPRWPARVPANWPEYPTSPTGPGAGITASGATGMALGATGVGRSIRVTRVYTSQGAGITVYSAAELRLGWPITCARAARFQVTAEVASGVQTQRFDHLEGEWSAREGIALGPHFPGLVFGATVPLVFEAMPLGGNVIAWLLAVVAAIDLPGVVRGLVRRRRGQCARCGYVLGELAVCPECGAAAASRGRG